MNLSSLVIPAMPGPLATLDTKLPANGPNVTPWAVPGQSRDREPDIALRGEGRGPVLRVGHPVSFPTDLTPRSSS